MTNEKKPWSYEDDIPDGTDWDEILSELRLLTRHYIASCQTRFGALEIMLHDSKPGDAEREAMLRMASEGREISKPLTIYLNKISEYVLRLRDKDDTDT